MPRFFGALRSDHDHIAAESARLLTRLWAPFAGRTGCSPWILPKQTSFAGSQSEIVFGADDSQAAHHAKSTMLKQHSRYLSLQKYKMSMLLISNGTHTLRMMTSSHRRLDSSNQWAADTIRYVCASWFTFFIPVNTPIAMLGPHHKVNRAASNSYNLLLASIVQNLVSPVSACLLMYIVATLPDVHNCQVP